jgi:branched-chain amino acid transport system substrate-binding protein
LRADDDFGRAYSDTLATLIEGTDLTIVQEETYDPEGADVAAQVTSLASSNADAWVLGATLLACPTALNEAGAAGWKPITYMSGTCTSKTLVGAARENAEGVLSVSPLMDPSDPQWASNEAVVLYKEKIAQYGEGADLTNGIVAYGWSAGAMVAELFSRVEGDLTRLNVMETARSFADVSEVGLQIPGASFTVRPDDWFLGEQFNLVQYSVADEYFKIVGDLLVHDDQTEEITPDDLING